MSVFFKNVIVFWRTKTLFLEIKVVACFSFFFPPSLIFSLPLFLKKIILLLCVYGCFVCLYHMHAVALEARRVPQTPELELHCE